MAIASTDPILTEMLGNQVRRLLLRNAEIERFEAQYATKVVNGVEYPGIGIFELFDQLFGRGPAPRAQHVRDIIALGLVGGGVADRLADALIAGLPPSENLRLRALAQRLLGVTFIPAVLDEVAGKKRKAGSRTPGARVQPPDDTTPETRSDESAA